MQERLFGILHLLVLRGRMTTAELAAHFEVSGRTIRRDIDALCRSGVPLYAERGRGGGVQLVDGYVLDRSLLSRQEQVDLLAALQSLAAARYPLDGAVQDKLRALFGAREAPWIDVDFSDWSNLHRGLFLDLRRAILERRVVAFTYFNARGEVRARTAEPLQLRFKGRAWYLLAHCRSAQDLRLFKLTRMEGVQLLEERFTRSAPPQAGEPPPLPEFEAPETVLRVDASLTYRVLDEFEPGQRQRQPDGSFLVRVRYPVDAWLVGYLLSFGPEAEVLEPPGLREAVREALQKTADRYGK